MIYYSMDINDMSRVFVIETISITEKIWGRYISDASLIEMDLVRMRFPLNMLVIVL